MNTILLIEDDDDDVMFFEEALREVEPESVFIHSYNGKKALDTLEELGMKTPTLIFVDLNLPGMDGLSCIEKIRLRKKLNEVPIYILTTTDNPLTRIEGLRKGANGFFTKPHNKQELISLIREAIS